MGNEWKLFSISFPLFPRVPNAPFLFTTQMKCLHVFVMYILHSHHIVHYEGQGGPVQTNSKPRLEILALCGRALENLRPDVQHLLSHLKTDANSSIYAATHLKQVHNPS